eukprot:tig00021127_g18739.t1
MSFSGFSSSDKLFNIGTDEKVGMSLDDIIKKSRTGAKPQRKAPAAAQKGKAVAGGRQNVARVRQNMKAATQTRVNVQAKTRIQAVSNRTKAVRGNRVEKMRGIQYTAETKKKQQQNVKAATRGQRKTTLAAARAQANAARIQANAARLRAKQTVNRALARATGRVPVGVTTRAMAGRGMRFVGGNLRSAVTTRLSARNRGAQPGAMQIKIVNDIASRPSGQRAESITYAFHALREEGLSLLIKPAHDVRCQVPDSSLRGCGPHRYIIFTQRVQRAPVKQLRRAVPAATAVARVQQATRGRQTAIATRRGIQPVQAPARVARQAARQRLAAVQPVSIRQRLSVPQQRVYEEYYDEPVYAAAPPRRAAQASGYMTRQQPMAQRLSRPVQAAPAYDFGVEYEEPVYAAPVRGRGMARYAVVQPAAPVRRQPVRRQAQPVAYFDDPSYADPYHPHALPRNAFVRQ